MEHKVITRSEVKALEAESRKIKCWALWFLDTRGRDTLLGCYPSADEAEEAQREEFGHRGAAERFAVIGLSQRSLAPLC